MRKVRSDKGIPKVCPQCGRRQIGYTGQRRKGKLKFHCWAPLCNYSWWV